MSAQYTISNENITFKERFAYGIGDFGSNLFLCIGTLYLLKFYTDELNIPAAYGGVIFLISKFFTAFTDILTGLILDSRKTIGPRGKFRPFILFVSFPTLLVTIAQFVPLTFTLEYKVIVATLIFMSFGLCYSLMNCSYGAMVPAITKNPHERATFASFRQGGSTLGLLTCSVAFIPLQKAFEVYGVYSYTVAACIFSIGGVICMTICYLYVKERYTEIATDAERPSIVKSLGSLFNNKPLLVLAIVNLCTLGAFNIKLAMQVYYCQYVLNDVYLLSYMGFFSMGCVLIGVLLVPKTTEIFGKKKVYVAGLFIWVIGDALNYFLGNNEILFVIFSCVTFLGTAFANSLNWALVPDTVDYGEWKTGIRAEGAVYTGYTFSRKISAAMAGFLPGILLAYVGYVANTTQTTQTIEGLRVLIFVIPGALALFAMLTMFIFYHLDEQTYYKISNELNLKRQKQNN